MDSSSGYYNRYWDAFSEKEQGTIKHHWDKELSPTGLEEVRTEVHRILSEHSLNDTWLSKYGSYYHELLGKLNVVIKQMKKRRYRSIDDDWSPPAN